MTDPIERIDALTRNARNTWFALLSALLFVGVTLMGVEHIDFYGVDRATQLPLIGVSVPTPLFFYAAPVLTTAIYCYFHLYLIRLWDALGSAPARVNGTRLGDAISPWLLTDAALHLRRYLRRDNCTAPRALEGASALVNFALSWGLGWVVLTYAWSQSLPARNLWMSQIAAASLALAFVFGAASLAMAYQRLGSQTRGNSEEAHRIWSTVPAISGLLALLTALPALTWQKTSGSADRLAQLDLTGEALVEKPADWLPYEIARKDFRAIWCRREKIDGCRDLGERESDFEDDWHSRFKARIAGLTKPKWSAPKAQSPNLRDARLPQTFLVGANLVGAQMQNAVLFGAQLQGAQFDLSHLTGSQEQPIYLALTNLSASTNNGGALRFVDLSHADFDHRTDWRNVFLDGSVTIPHPFEKRMNTPCQWVEEILSEEEFYGRSRGWIERGSTTRWFSVAPKGWQDVTPIPPPEGCTWKTDPMPRWHGGGR